MNSSMLVLAFFRSSPQRSTDEGMGRHEWNKAILA